RAPHGGYIKATDSRKVHVGHQRCHASCQCFRQASWQKQSHDLQVWCHAVSMNGSTSDDSYSHTLYSPHLHSNSNST
ncbi:hypothetical protein P7K49_000125, partial [Saguinus oedipus]